MRRPARFATAFSVVAALAIDTAVLFAWAHRESTGVRGMQISGTSILRKPLTSPVDRLGGWLRAENAPRTPLGLLGLFDGRELANLAGLVGLWALLSLVLVHLFRTTGPEQDRVASPLLNRGISLRAGLVLIAILAVWLAAETQGRKVWRLRQLYVSKARGAAWAESQARTDRLWARGKIVDLDAAQTFDDVEDPDVRLDIERRYGGDPHAFADAIRRSLHRAEADLEFKKAMRHKYEAAARDPLKPVPPDPLPPPEVR